MKTYPVKAATDPLKIEECQYGIADEICFSKFTSCLGVICATTDKKVIGVHLVKVDAADKEFKADDVDAIEKVLTDNNAILDTGWVVGVLDNWPLDIKARFWQLFEDYDEGRTIKGAGYYAAKFKSDKADVKHTP